MKKTVKFSIVMILSSLAIAFAVNAWAGNYDTDVNHKGDRLLALNWKFWDKDKKVESELLTKVRGFIKGMNKGSDYRCKEDFQYNISKTQSVNSPYVAEVYIFMTAIHSSYDQDGQYHRRVFYFAYQDDKWVPKGSASAS